MEKVSRSCASKASVVSVRMVSRVDADIGGHHGQFLRRDGGKDRPSALSLRPRGNAWPYPNPPLWGHLNCPIRPVSEEQPAIACEKPDVQLEQGASTSWPVMAHSGRGPDHRTRPEAPLKGPHQARRERFGLVQSPRSPRQWRVATPNCGREGGRSPAWWCDPARFRPVRASA